MDSYFAVGYVALWSLAVFQALVAIGLLHRISLFERDYQPGGLAISTMA
jgi:hypothetical protein